jgi:hypothetical protein
VPSPLSLLISKINQRELEGVIGVSLTQSILTEVGYRALSIDYENDGLLFDAITHGPQITTGITF